MFHIHHGRGTDAYYLQQFRNDSVSKTAAFYCKYHMFSTIFVSTLYTSSITVHVPVEDIMYSSFFSVSQQPISGLSRLLFLKFQDHNQLNTHTHTHIRSDSSKRVIRTSQRPLLTQHTQETYIHALGGIRTRNPSILAP